MAVVAVSGYSEAWVVAAGVLFGILCWWIIQRGGWPGWLGFLLGFFLALVGVAVTLVLTYGFPRRKRPKEDAEKEPRLCSRCGQPLEDDASFCGFCGKPS